jgi:hypothetical protein
MNAQEQSTLPQQRGHVRKYHDARLSRNDVENYVLIQSIIERKVTIYYDRSSQNFCSIAEGSSSYDEDKDGLQTAHNNQIQEKDKISFTQLPHKRRLSDIDINLEWTISKSDSNADTYDPLAYFMAGLETTDTVLLTCTI